MRRVLKIMPQEQSTSIRSKSMTLPILQAGLGVMGAAFWINSASALGSDAANLAKLQSDIIAQKSMLKQEELELEQEALKLDQTQMLLDQQMQRLHGRGTSAAAASTANPSSPPAVETTSISGPTPSEQQTKVVLQTDTTLANAGGVLTPRGDIVLDPSLNQI